MIPSDHQRLLVKTARLYYEAELTQSEISKRLHLSRQKIQRLLQESRDQGIVRISIHPMMGVYEDLEQALEMRFDLLEAIIVETSAYDDQSIVTREIGVGAAGYLMRVLQPRDAVVVSWGGSLLGMVDALWARRPSPTPEGIKVVQGLGGLGDPINETHGADLTRRLAKILDGQAILLPAPGVAGMPEVGQSFLDDPFVAGALLQGSKANLAFMGIGAPRHDSILMREGTIVHWPELRTLQQRGAVGDINLRFFDEDGQLVSSDLNDRVIGLTLDEIRSIETVVGIAGGEEKLNAVLGSVRGGLINVLVTDHITAEKLVAL
jgi:DNA-binding transcriptional regulator LsrR (DeoR family)